jgi:hypothetical protein
MAITKTKVITLTVALQEGDFNIQAADTLSVKAGTTGSFTIAIHALLGFNKAVKFSISGGPAGMTTTWAPSDTLPVGGTNIQCNLAIPLDNALAGNYPLTLTGVSQ